MAGGVVCFSRGCSLVRIAAALRNILARTRFGTSEMLSSGRVLLYSSDHSVPAYRTTPFPSMKNLQTTGILPCLIRTEVLSLFTCLTGKPSFGCSRVPIRNLLSEACTVLRARLSKASSNLFLAGMLPLVRNFVAAAKSAATYSVL